jgi:hypothetical protein
MAHIIKSGIITDIRGKLNGSRFQSGVYGLSVRHCRKRKKSITEKERQQLNYTAQLTDIWKTLTLTQQQTWGLWCHWQDQHSKHNSSQIITALCGFIKVNLPRLKYGIAVLTNAPMTNTVPLFSIMSLTAGPGNQLLLNSSVIVPINNIAVIKISPVKEPGCTINKNECKAITQLISNGNIWNVTADYNSLYGSAVFTGTIIGLSYSQIDLNSGLRLPEVFKICQL